VVNPSGPAPSRRRMSLSGRIAAFALAALVAGVQAAPRAAAAEAAGPAAGSRGAALHLPLEVLGDGSPSTPVIARARLNLPADQLAVASRLVFTCHRCAFFGAPEFEATTMPPVRVKASVRVVGGNDADHRAGANWIDVTDANVQLADPERVQGGLARGGLYTARITLPLDTATRARLVASPRHNLVEFRFNGTDGESNGYRVIALQLQDDAGHALATNPVVFADIGAEKAAGRAMSPDVTAGDQLWHAQDRLWKSTLVPRTMHAACASCHAPTGRDLQYFNYSNNAITQRARFHGLSDAQGRQIAAYIRYGQQAVPHVAAAAPWNPPYQPGPGLDAKPIQEWAAGAGLGAVLETPTQSLKALFGQPVDATPLKVSQAEVDKVMDANATLNTRQLQVPVQYPDWNAWLPAVHPMDVWPTGDGAQGSFQSGGQFAIGGFNDPNGNAAKIEAWLQANRNPNGQYGDWSHLSATQRRDINQMFTMSGWSAYNFLGGGRGNHVAPSGESGAQVGARLLQARASAATTALEPQAATPNAFIERAVASMLQWNAVQQWHWATTYGLEGDQRWFLGSYDTSTNAWQGRGEARGWPFNTVSAFFVAPHMMYQQDTDAAGNVTRQWLFAWETANPIGSYYRTNAWYQMQATINPGAQSDFVNFPMDWPYLTAFDDVLSNTLGTATPAQKTAAMNANARMLMARIKIAQYVDNAITLYDPTYTGSLINNRGRYGRAQALKHVSPINFIDTTTTYDGLSNFSSIYDRFDELQPGLHLEIVNGAMQQFNTLFAGTDPAKWRRCDPANLDLGEPEPTAGFAFCVDRTKTPLTPTAAGGFAMKVDSFNRAPQEQAQQYGQWKARQMGADANRIATWSAWTARVWP